MKRILLFSSIIFMSLVLFSQRIKEEATVINIEVPVRVFSGKAFIDNLTIDNFGVLEKGKHHEKNNLYPGNSIINIFSLPSTRTARSHSQKH